MYEYINFFLVISINLRNRMILKQKRDEMKGKKTLKKRRVKLRRDGKIRERETIKCNLFS